MNTIGIIKLVIANSFCLCIAMTNRCVRLARARELLGSRISPHPIKLEILYQDVIGSPGGKGGPMYHINIAKSRLCYT